MEKIKYHQLERVDLRIFITRLMYEKTQQLPGQIWLGQKWPLLLNSHIIKILFLNNLKQ